MSYYDDLGVARDATPELIKRAWRIIRSKHHPDHHGQTARYVALKRAYETLMDPERRARYDATGDEGAAGDPRAALLSALASLFLSAIAALDPDQVDILLVVRKKLDEAERVSKQSASEHAIAIKRRESALKRLKHKGELDIVRQVIEGDIAQHRQHIARYEQEAVQVRAVRELLAEYEYSTDGIRRGGGAHWIDTTQPHFVRGFHP